MKNKTYLLITLITLLSFCHLSAADLNGSISAEVSCVSTNNGSSASIDLTVEGAFSPFDFQWSNGETSEDIDGLEEGDYTVTVTDALCGEAILTITAYDCCDDCYPIDANIGLGSIQVEIECQESNGFTYQWSDGGTGNPRNDLAIGTYCVTATSSNGCVQIGCWDVDTECLTTPVTDSNVEITHSCSAAPMSGSLFVLNAQQNLYYFWTGPNNYQAEGVLIDNLYPGEYCLSITGNIFGSPCPIAAGCFTIGLDGDQCCDDCYPIEAEVTPGEIHVHVECQETGLFTYEWSDGGSGNPRKDLEPGVYCVTMTSSALSGDCSLSGCWEVTEACLDVVNLNAPSLENYFNITCSSGSNGSIEVRDELPSYVSYPNAFSLWTRVDGTYVGSGRDLTNLAPGEYCLTIQPSLWGGCVIAEGCFVVGESNLLVGISNVQNLPFCNGVNFSGSITLAVSPSTMGLSYSWVGSGGFTASTQNISGLDIGDYSVIVTNADGCTATASASICCCEQHPLSEGEPLPACHPGEGAPPNYLAVTLIEIIQIDDGIDFGSININASGGIDGLFYSWTGTGGFVAFTEDISGLGIGTYCVVVGDGCDKIERCYDIVDCGAIEWDINGEVERTCPGGNSGKITLGGISGGTSPYTYDWGNGAVDNNSIEGLAEGNHTVTVIDKNFCQGTATFNIGVNEVNITVTADILHTCSEDDYTQGDYGVITLTPTGENTPYTYSWSNGATGNPVEFLAEGSHQVTVYDSNGCPEVLGPFDINAENNYVPQEDDPYDCTVRYYCNGQFATERTEYNFDESGYDPDDCRYYLFQCKDIDDNYYPYIPAGFTEDFDDRSTIVHDFENCETRIECQDNAEPYSITPGDSFEMNFNSVDDGVGPDGCLYCFTATYCTLIVDDEEVTNYQGSVSKLNIIATEIPGVVCDPDNEESCFVNISCTYLPVGQDILYEDYCSPDCNAYDNNLDFICTDAEIDVIAEEGFLGSADDRAAGNDEKMELGNDGFAVKIYPNPFRLDFYFEIESYISRKVSLKVVNTTGSLIQELDFHVMEGNNVISNKSLSNQATGVYFLIFSDEDNPNLITLPIVKQ